MSTFPHKQIAVYGGTFCPATTQHRAVVKAMADAFKNQVVVIPCGPRLDKPELDDIAEVHRAAMADLAFGDLGVTVDLSDLEQAVFTRAEALDGRYSNDGEHEVWHVVGPDLVRGGGRGESLIQKNWENGPELWKRLKFVVVNHPGGFVRDEDMPPNARLAQVDVTCSATMLRNLLRTGGDTNGYLPPSVAEYIARHRLFREGPTSRVKRREHFVPRPIVVISRRNGPAKRIAADLGLLNDAEHPNCVIVIGGDGTMLRAIQMHWRKRLPFIGINAGHLGFLLNPVDAFATAESLNVCAQEDHGLVLLQAPMIYVETVNTKGETKTEVAFNDAWVERSSGQTAWMKLTVSGVDKINPLTADGLLVSTAAGSTAYAMSMGASPLLADTPAWLVVGSNVLTPFGWKSAMITLDDTVDIEVLDPVKRPMKAFAYGKSLGEVRSMHARISRVASVELAYVPTHDLAQKIRDLQFGITWTQPFKGKT